MYQVMQKYTLLYIDTTKLHEPMRQSKHTIFIAGGGATRVNARAGADKSISVSVCLRGVRLLFAWLA